MTFLFSWLLLVCSPNHGVIYVFLASSGQPADFLCFKLLWLKTATLCPSGAKTKMLLNLVFNVTVILFGRLWL